MRLLLVLAYLAVEIGAFVLMVSYLGFGWAVLISLLALVVGFAVLRSQGRKVFTELGRAARNEIDARAPLTDTALVAASSILLVIPGVVTTMVGTILMTPPARAVARPAVAAYGASKFAGSINRAGIIVTGSQMRGRVVDGTVVDSPGMSDSDAHNDDDGDGPGPNRPQLPRGY